MTGVQTCALRSPFNFFNLDLFNDPSISGCSERAAAGTQRAPIATTDVDDSILFTWHLAIAIAPVAQLRPQPDQNHHAEKQTNAADKGTQEH